MADNEQLPEGWSKHWSNTWKKHYWFNSKNGKQSWEPPTEESSPAKPAQPAVAGEKRKAEGQPTPEASKPTAAAPANKDNLRLAAAQNQKAPPPKALGGALGSILGGLGDLGNPMMTAKALEAKRRRKEAEGERRREEKEERDNYTEWVRESLLSFKEGSEQYHELPPADSLHRIIAKDEAEEQGLVSFSHGEEELKSVFVFHQHTAPNDLEMRYLQLGGNVAELMMKRAQGDKFEQYNTLFDELKHVKVVPKQRQSKAAAAQQQLDEAEIESRVVTVRSADEGSVSAATARIKEERNDRAA